MRSKKTIKYIIGIAVAAALPLSLYFIMRSLSDGRVKIPAFYRAERVDSSMQEGVMTYDTTFHKVKDVQLTNQLGKKISLNQDLRGKILVVNFIFTSCPTVCPRLTNSMKMIQKAFIKKNPDLVQFLSISVDPARDSVAALRAYANRFDADHDRWWFLTGDSKSIFDYAQNELGLTLQPADANDGAFDHSRQFVLIDTARNIRGYYDGFEAAETKQLADDIIILSMEKKKKKKK
jgi:protein SCO1/2